jgi:hypothetical protein
MSRSAARLPEPRTPPPTGERRRRIRQKLHTPVYASFNGPQTGVVVDLSELLDLSEEGFAVQTAVAAQDVAVDGLVEESDFSELSMARAAEPEPSGQEIEQRKTGGSEGNRLEVNQHVSLCLDLPETKSFVHGSGQVIWTDETGRAGVRFVPLAPDAAHTLKKWLFSNLLIGCANHSARKDQIARHREEIFEQSSLAASPATAAAPDVAEVSSAADAVLAVAAEPSPAAAIAQRAELLSALDELRNQIRKLTSGQIAAVETQAGEAAADPASAILQLITERAAALTGATGAALALEENGEMFCRARVGDPAPELGSHVDVSQGVSGECVRTVRPILCHDTTADRRVDLELCRALGLGSFLAVPIVSDFRVTGLFEVFSTHPRAFSSDEITILQRLAELVPSAQPDKRVANPPVAADRSVSEVEEKSATPHDAAVAPGSVVAPSETEAPEASAAGARIAETLPEPPSPESSSDDICDSAAMHDSSVAGINPLDHLRAALWDHASELEEQARRAEMHPGEINSDAIDPDKTGSGEIDRDHIKVNDKSGLESNFAGSRPRSHAVLKKAADEQVDEDDESVVAQDSDADSDPDARASSPIHHLGLLLVCLAVVALALGYLLAPVIERHLNAAADATSSGTVQAASPSKTQSLSPEETRKLADQGDSEAQFVLGTLYRNGDGVLQDDSKAIEWFQRAADQGHPLALRALGSAYWGGRGVEQNYARAYFWYELALAMGDQESKSKLEGLATQMTQRQVTDARQQAEAWLQAHNQPPKTASN